MNSFEQEVAKGNTDASLADRASAGAKAVGDKIDETTQCAFPSPESLMVPCTDSNYLTLIAAAPRRSVYAFGSFAARTLTLCDCTQDLHEDAAKA